jgi:hypothetical protein
MFEKGNKHGSTKQGAKKVIMAIRQKFEDNIDLIVAEVEKEIHEDPLKAYMTYFLPTMPKNIELSNDESSEFTVTWKS